MEERKAVIKAADMTDEMQQDAVDCAVQVREGGSGGGRRCRCFCPMRAVLEKKSGGGGGGARGRAEGGRTSSWVPFRPRARAQALALGLPLRALAAVCGPRARKAKKRDGPAPAPAARPASPPPSGPASHPSPFLVPLLTAQAIDKYTIEKDIATFVKKEFDKKHTPTWHCVVGRNFGERGEKERRGRGREGRPTGARPRVRLGGPTRTSRGLLSPISFHAQAPTSPTRPSTLSTFTSVRARSEEGRGALL